MIIWWAFTTRFYWMNRFFNRVVIMYYLSFAWEFTLSSSLVGSLVCLITALLFWPLVRSLLQINPSPVTSLPASLFHFLSPPVSLVLLMMCTHRHTHTYTTHQNRSFFLTFWWLYEWKCLDLYRKTFYVLSCWPCFPLISHFLLPFWR